jgi:AbrB family looped-hinge helix DNA binding protein
MLYVMIVKEGNMGSCVENVVRARSRINANGRVVIPAEMRQQMGLKPGDSIVMSVEDGVLKVESLQARVRRVQQSLRKYIDPTRLLSDELIAERREEVRREAAGDE